MAMHCKVLHTESKSVFAKWIKNKYSDAVKCCFLKETIAYRQVNMTPLA